MCMTETTYLTFCDSNTGIHIKTKNPTTYLYRYCKMYLQIHV